MKTFLKLTLLSILVALGVALCANSGPRQSHQSQQAIKSQFDKCTKSCVETHAAHFGAVVSCIEANGIAATCGSGDILDLDGVAAQCVALCRPDDTSMRKDARIILKRNECVGRCAASYGDRESCLSQC